MEVERIGFFERIKNAFVGVLIGVVLFFASFFVLYVNEGLQKFTEVIDNATEVQSDQSVAEGVIWHTGLLRANSSVAGDEEYISGGNFMFLKRVVDVYAWQEIKTTNTESNVGGSQTQRTEYQYETQWLNVPPRTSSFRDTRGHENPQKTIADSDWYAKGVYVGNFPIQGVNSLSLHNMKPVMLRDVNVIKGDADNRYIFISKSGTSTLQTPQVGDHRISYRAVPLDTETTFVGALRNGSFRAHAEPHAFDLFAGDRSDARAVAKSEDAARIWGLRLLGFLMMAIGLFLVVGPLTVLLDVIPIFGTVSRFVVSLAAMLIAFVLSILTILVSMIFHNLIALLVVIVLAIIGIVYFFTRKKRGRRMRRDGRPQRPGRRPMRPHRDRDHDDDRG